MIKFTVAKINGVTKAYLEDTAGNVRIDYSGTIFVNFGTNEVKVQMNSNTTHIRPDVIQIADEVYTKLFNGSFIYVD